jgi:hypothetical protein
MTVVSMCHVSSGPLVRRPTFGFAGWIRSRGRRRAISGDILEFLARVLVIQTIWVWHYHEERPHQGLGNELIAPKTTAIGAGRVKCRERIGGLLKFYYREAA